MHLDGQCGGSGVQPQKQGRVAGWCKPDLLIGTWARAALALQPCPPPTPFVLTYFPRAMVVAETDAQEEFCLKSMLEKSAWPN